MTPAPGHRDNRKGQGTSQRQKKVQKQRPKHGVRLRLKERETGDAETGTDSPSQQDRQKYTRQQQLTYSRNKGAFLVNTAGNELSGC